MLPNEQTKISGIERVPETRDRIMNERSVVSPVLFALTRESNSVARPTIFRGVSRPAYGRLANNSIADTRRDSTC